MFGLQPTHLIIVLVVALLLFAPSRLPALVRALGKMIIEFRASIKETGQNAPSEQSKNEPRREPPL